MLEVCIDFKSPGSYLALKPTLALVDRLGIAVEWHPYKTYERDIPEEGTEESVALRHQRVRAQSLRATHIKYASLQGIDLRYPSARIETDLALGTLAAIDGDPTDFINAAFSAYWNEHLDLNDEEVVAEILSSSAVCEAGLLAKAPASLAAAQEAAEGRGIVDAPAYIIDEQIFVGRQHLHWIEEIASRKE